MVKKFSIVGMSCSACSSAIENGLNKVNGINSVKVNLLSNSMDVDYDDSIINDSLICNKVKDIGYDAYLYNRDYHKNNNSLFTKLILSIILMVLLVYISMGYMFNILPDILLKDNIVFYLAIGQLIITSLIYLINSHYFTNGFSAVFKLYPNMDSLIAIGASASYIYSLYPLLLICLGDISHMHSLYFECGGVIVTLVSVGKYIEAKSKSKTTSAIEKLMDLQPKVICVLKDNIEILVDIEDVKIGDVVVVKAGETIGCDGIIIKGETTVNESMISGESLPVEKRLYDRVIGASVNLTNYILIKVDKEIKDNTLSKIIELVEIAANSKAPISKFVDKVSYFFVPTIIFLSLITFIYWFIIYQDMTLAIEFALAVLVVSCPCALGLATPSAIMLATGIGASNNILIKDASTLELASHIDTIFLDKTNTITKGELSIVKEVEYHKDFLLYAYNLERHSNHPLAKSITNKYHYQDLEFDKIKELTGKGLVGHINNDIFLAGNLALLLDYDIDVDSIIQDITKWVEQGLTYIVICKNKNILGLLWLCDEIKETSVSAIKQLKDLNIQTVMLSGDNNVVTKNIGEMIGIDKYYGSLLPKDKKDHIMKYQDNKSIVGMVGDGINDSIALVQADIGVSISSGSGIAIDSANIILTNNDLMGVVKMIKLSKATMKKIKENLFWALLYNIIGIPLAMGILYIPLGLKLNPMFAAFAMSCSSISVVLNTLRLNNVKLNIKQKDMEKIIFVDNMTCGHCKKRVEDLFNVIPGITCNVDLETKQVKIIGDLKLNDEQINKMITDAGYKLL